jgi:hypothetical protein
MIVVGLAAIGSLCINPVRYSRKDIKSCFEASDHFRKLSSGHVPVFSLFLPPIPELQLTVFPTGQPR